MKSVRISRNWTLFMARAAGWMSNELEDGAGERNRSLRGLRQPHALLRAGPRRAPDVRRPGCHRKPACLRRISHRDPLLRQLPHRAPALPGAEAGAFSGKLSLSFALHGRRAVRHEEPRRFLRATL